MSNFDFEFERRDDGVAVLTLNRPDSLNSLTFEIYGQLERLFLDLQTDDSVKAVVLTGVMEQTPSGSTMEPSEEACN